MKIIDLEQTLSSCKEPFDFSDEVKEVIYLQNLLQSSRLDLSKIHVSLIQFAHDLACEEYPEDLMYYKQELFDCAQKVENARTIFFLKKDTHTFEDFCNTYGIFLKELIEELGQKILICDSENAEDRT